MKSENINTHRTPLNVIENVKQRQSTLHLALVLIDVGHHLLDRLQRLLQLLVVGIRFRRMLENVADQQTDARQSLHRPNHQVLQRLPAALGLGLVDL